MLRADVHCEFERPSMEKTDVSNYHGGMLSDEIAAVSSLAMGCRVKAGPITREFDAGDARGRPIAYYGFAAPTLAHGSRGRTLPSSVGPHSLEDLDWFAEPANPALKTKSRSFVPPDCIRTHCGWPTQSPPWPG